ncbi:unnamed protein product [Phytomonas sp. EM1]|nr:unnamed protein product [Phytomonas sp. EM1]|eukprot:CCW61691.1 unnamed protein product [Phytomonas sp. isolate EM1]
MSENKYDQLDSHANIYDHEASGTLISITPASGGLRPWHYNLFTCCFEANSCLEACFCFYCQLVRQHNMFYNLKPEIDIPMCFLVVILDYLTFSWFSFSYLFMLRRSIRERYGIKGHMCTDCLSVLFCGCCALQQQLLEMTSQGSFPGATLYKNPTPPSEVHMI